MDPKIEKGGSQDRGLELYDQLVKERERGGQIGLVTFARSDICANDICAK